MDVNGYSFGKRYSVGEILFDRSCSSQTAVDGFVDDLFGHYCTPYKLNFSKSA